MEQQVAVRTEELKQAQEELAQHAHQLRLLLAETVTAQERERARIAHNMHDGANQLIFGALLEVKAAQERLAQGNNETCGRCPGARARRAQGGGWRDQAHHLSPAPADAGRARPACRADALRGTLHGIRPLTLHRSGRGRAAPTAPEMEIGIYRVTQEALQNASIHAQASSTKVTLSYMPDAFQLSVRDDGVGFEPEHVLGQREGCLGVLGMHERAQHLGGALAIGSKAGQGTEVVLDLPIAGSA